MSKSNEQTKNVSGTSGLRTNYPKQTGTDPLQTKQAPTSGNVPNVLGGINKGLDPQSPGGIHYRIRVVSANITHETDMYTKIDPYVVLKLGEQRYQTSVCKGSGRQPGWSDVFEVARPEKINEINIELWDKDEDGEDKQLATGGLQIADIVPESIVYEVRLYYQNKNAGFLALECAKL